jgi:hypothetical protein
MPGRVLAAVVCVAALVGLLAVWFGGPGGDDILPTPYGAPSATADPSTPPIPLAPATAPAGARTALPTPGRPGTAIGTPPPPRTVRAGDAVRGVVRDAEGRPVAGAEVLVQVGGRQTGVVTGVDGRFEIRVPSDGEAQLVVRAPGRAPLQQPVGVEPELQLALVAEAQITGRVEDPAGAGVAGAFVRAESMDDPALAPTVVQTGPEGHFLVPGLAANARYRLRATHPQHASGPPLEVAAPAADLMLALLPGATLRVRVLGANGEALPELPPPDPAASPGFMALRAYAVLNGGGTSRTLSNWVDADRALIKVEGLAAGTYTLSAAVRGHGRGETGEIVVPGSGEIEASLQLATGGFLRVRVVDAAGAAVPGAEVQPAKDFGTGWAYLLAGKTDGDGRVRLGPFPAGPTQLKCRLEGAWIETAATVSAGSEIDVEIRLAAGG